MWFFTSLLAKIASAGVIGQAATGAGVVLVGVTGLGAAGALPDPVQHTFSTVVSAVEPADTGVPAAVTAPAPSSDPATLPTAPVLPTGADSTGGAVVDTPVTPAPESDNSGGQAGEQADQNAQGDDTETDAPETQAPEADSPETEAPETHAPETHARETHAPESGGSASDGSSSDSGDQSDSGNHSHD